MLQENQSGIDQVNFLNPPELRFHQVLLGMPYEPYALQYALLKWPFSVQDQFVQQLPHPI